jgi:hypothetical protein
MTEITDNKKWFISILSGIIFYVIAAPRIYKITGKIIYKIFAVKIENKGKPNNLGLLIHTIIFVLITRFLMDLNL